MDRDLCGPMKYYDFGGNRPWRKDAKHVLRTAVDSSVAWNVAVIPIKPGLEAIKCLIATHDD